MHTTHRTRLMPFTTLRFIALLLLPAAVPLAVAQQPQVTNAEFSTQPAGDLARTLDRLEHAPAALWVAYLFPTDRPMTTNRGYSGVIHLEQTSSDGGYQGGASTQSSDEALLMLRMADGEISSARGAAYGCTGRGRFALCVPHGRAAGTERRGTQVHRPDGAESSPAQGRGFLRVAPSVPRGGSHA